MNGSRVVTTIGLIELLKSSCCWGIWIVFVFLEMFAYYNKFTTFVSWCFEYCWLHFHFTNGTISLYLQMETRKRLAKIVLVFVGCFVFCWFPNHILYMYRSFNYNKIDPSLGHMIVTLVARILSFCNSCVNPFALYLLSESFRRHFNSQLCCRRKSYPERSASYLVSSSAVRMTSLKSNAKNVVTNSVLQNGHMVKQEMAL